MRFLHPWPLSAIYSDAPIIERLRKLGSEIDDLVFGPGFRSSPAHEGVAAGNSHIRVDNFVAMGQIKNHIRLSFIRIGVTVQSHAFCGGEFNLDIVVIKLDCVVTWLGRLVFVIETRGVTRSTIACLGGVHG